MSAHVLMQQEQWVAAQVARYPAHLQAGITYRYKAMRNRTLRTGKERQGVLDDGREREANLWLASLAKRFPEHMLPLGASDEQLCAFAKERASEAALKLSAVPSLVVLAEYCAHYGVPVPRGTCDETIIKRASCDRWWRRALRRSRSREAEALAIEIGMVTRRRQLYASHDAVNMRRAQKRRNQAVLDAMVAINELGESFKLSELVDKSVSNPALRRVELMCRMSGFESIAQGLELAGEFVTLTAPSRFHSHHAASSTRNSKWDGSSPRDTADYLCRVWSRITSALDRAGIRIFGMRIAEPHHDATPHFHCLFFLRKQDRRNFRLIVARYAVREDRAELGLNYACNKADAMRQARALRATGTHESLKVLAERIDWETRFWQSISNGVWKAIKARVDFKAIDWTRGTATGYLIKYVAKNIDGRRQDGESAGVDYEAAEDIDGGNDMMATARRADAWAATWGIRQFQQVGGPPVTVWRELRRWEVEGADNTIELAAIAADVGDWGRFVEVMGGWEQRRRAMPLKAITRPATVPNRYGEEGMPSILGVVDVETGFLAITRTHVWEIQRDVTQSGRAATAWTRVNNSTKSTFTGKAAIPVPAHFEEMDRAATEKDIERWLDDTANDELMRRIHPQDDAYQSPEALNKARATQNKALYDYRTLRETALREDGEYADWMVQDLLAHFEQAQAKREQIRAQVEASSTIKNITRRYQQRHRGLVETLETLKAAKAAQQREASRPSKHQAIRFGQPLAVQHASTLERGRKELARGSQWHEDKAQDMTSAAIAKAQALMQRIRQGNS